MSPLPYFKLVNKFQDLNPQNKNQKTLKQEPTQKHIESNNIGVIFFTKKKEKENNRTNTMMSNAKIKVQI